LGTMDSMQQGAPTQASGPQDEQALCTQNEYATEACNALYNLNQTWQPLFQQAGIEFRQPTLHFIGGGGVNTGCGAAPSAPAPHCAPASITGTRRQPPATSGASSHPAHRKPTTPRSARSRKPLATPAPGPARIATRSSREISRKA